MGLHYDSLRDFLEMVNGEFDLKEKPDMKSYLKRAFCEANHYYLPFLSQELYVQDGYTPEQIIDLSSQYTAEAGLEGLLFKTPTDLTIVEDVDSLVVLDQEEESARTTVFMIHPEFASLGSARLEPIDLTNKEKLKFLVKAPVYFNAWKEGKSILDCLPPDSYMAMAQDIVSATVSCLEELSYLKHKGELI